MCLMIFPSTLQDMVTFLINMVRVVNMYHVPSLSENVLLISQLTQTGKIV